MTFWLPSDSILTVVSKYSRTSYSEYKKIFDRRSEATQKKTTFSTAENADRGGTGSSPVYRMLILFLVVPLDY